MTLADEIIRQLQDLEPAELNLIDESAMHAGHKGNGGGGHFKLKITSSHFCGKSQIMRHRLIYQSLTKFIPHKIHALSIEAIATNDG